MLQSRFSQALLCFVVLTIAYWTYAQTVVPWMQPPARVSQSGGTDSDAVAYESPTAPYRKLLEPLFRADSWERAPDAKIIKTEDLILLLRDYHALDDGRLQLTPCTVVYLPRQSERRVWIMQAAEGAILQFDRPFDLRGAGVGRLQSGFLPGHVIISGGPSQPGGEDRIEIDTRGIQLTEEAISTTQDVHFRFGKSFGSGRDLTIRMQPRGGGELQRLPSPSPTQVRQIELVHLEQAVVFLPATADTAHPGPAATTDEPVRIRCQGPVLLDLEAGLFRVSRNVHIERSPTGQPSDHVYCDRLTAHLSRPQPDDPADAPQPDSPLGIPNLQLGRVVVSGQPAVFTGTSRSATDTRMRWHRLESTRVEYVRQHPPLLGQVQAGGPGSYQTGWLPDDQPQVELAWQDRLEWQQQADEVQLALVGDALCRAQDVGRVQAGTLWVQLQRTSGSGPAATDVLARAGDLGRLQPKQIVAEQQVRIENDSLVAQTHRLDVELRDPPPLQPPPALPQAPAEGATPRAAGTHRSALNRLALDRPQAAGARRRFDVHGDRMQLRLILHPGQPQVDDVLLAGHVRCLEQLDPQQTAPLEMQGDQFQLSQLTPTGGLAVMHGAPALIRARQLLLAGTSIHLDRDRNRIWIDGRGSATLPLPSRVAERFANRPATADVTWEGGLQFDGQTIHCQERVLVQGPEQRLRADTLTGTLTRPIEFGANRLDAEQVQLSAVTADGDVELENRTLDESGWASVDLGHLESLRIDQQSQKIIGTGPGWIETVRRGFAEIPGTELGGEAVDGTRGLAFLRVEFQKGFEGDIAQRQVAFHDRVQAVYGSVSDWNDRLTIETADRLRPESATLRCQQLTIFQLPGQTTAGQFELLALGNTLVEGKSAAGQLFAARAQRLSFHQSKDLLMLQGDRRAEAQLWYQQGAGGRRSTVSAEQIRYWPRSGHYRLGGAGMLELGG